MSDETLRFEAGDGAVVELDRAALGALGAGESIASPWTVEAPPDWSRYESLRLLAATFADGSITALVALRPEDADGHDADEVSAVLAEPRKRPEGAHEALLSTEVDSERRIRRVGVELWTSEEPPPRRFAADRTRLETSDADGVEREAALMEARLDGESGTALFEVLRPVG